MKELWRKIKVTHLKCLVQKRVGATTRENIPQQRHFEDWSFEGWMVEERSDHQLKVNCGKLEPPTRFTHRNSDTGQTGDLPLYFSTLELTWIRTFIWNHISDFEISTLFLNWKLKQKIYIISFLFLSPSSSSVKLNICFAAWFPKSVQGLHTTAIRDAYFIENLPQPFSKSRNEGREETRLQSRMKNLQLQLIEVDVLICRSLAHRLHEKRLIVRVHVHARKKHQLSLKIIIVIEKKHNSWHFYQLCWFLFFSLPPLDMFFRTCCSGGGERCISGSINSRTAVGMQSNAV